MKREIYKVYRDKRGWTYMVQCRRAGNGERYYTSAYLKKGDLLFHLKRVNGSHAWKTKEEAEKELKKYAEAHDMKAVF